MQKNLLHSLNKRLKNIYLAMGVGMDLFFSNSFFLSDMDIIAGSTFSASGVTPSIKQIQQKRLNVGVLTK